MSDINKFAAIIVTLLWCLDCTAQQFGLSWISYPQPDSCAVVWFRQLFTAEGRPRHACITVATTGYVELYVNQRNVTGDVLTPLREPMSDNPIAITYDVTRFMRPDTNTVAVCFAPSFPHIVPAQMALSFYGRDADGKPFAYNTDDGWLCRTDATSLTKDGYERIDATKSPISSYTGDLDVACWIPSVMAETTGMRPAEQRMIRYAAAKIGDIRQQRYFDIEGDSVVYDFGTAFKGLVRVTLRDAIPGEHINIGGMEYTCSGDADEQAIQRFTTTDCRRLLICGDEHFDREQIQKVEALEIITYTRDLEE